MPWITPKLDWAAGNGIGSNDLNRIEGNIDYLKNDYLDGVEKELKDLINLSFTLSGDSTVAGVGTAHEILSYDTMVMDHRQLILPVGYDLMCVRHTLTWGGDRERTQLVQPVIYAARVTSPYSNNPTYEPLYEYRSFGSNRYRLQCFTGDGGANPYHGKAIRDGLSHGYNRAAPEFLGVWETKFNCTDVLTRLQDETSGTPIHILIGLDLSQYSSGAFDNEIRFSATFMLEPIA